MNARRLVVSLMAALWAGYANAAPVSAKAQATTNDLAHAFSLSRQFAVYSSNPMLPTALSVFAEHIKREWLARLEMSDNWRDPIIILLRDRTAAESEAPAQWLDLMRSDLHLRYQINCLTPPPLNEAALHSIITEALCAELAYRTSNDAHPAPLRAVPMPAWLIEGLAQSIGGRHDELLSVARRSVLAGRPPSAREILATTRAPADPQEQQMFQAHAWLFIEGLLALPEAGGRLQGFLSALGATQSPSDAFRTAYGDLFPKPVALEKWWILQQSYHTVFASAGALPAAETERRLDEILQTKIKLAHHKGADPTETIVGFEQLQKFYEQRWLKALVKEKLGRLEALAGESHPQYRASIVAYCGALHWLLDERLTRFTATLRQAAAMHTAARRDTQAAAIYLDEVERLQNGEGPGAAFSNVLQLFDEMNTFEQQRHTPISDHLDQFDK